MTTTDASAASASYAARTRGTSCGDRGPQLLGEQNRGLFGGIGQQQGEGVTAVSGQLLIRSDGDLGGRRGMMAERVFQTRYDGPKGSIGPLSHAWCLGLLLHAAELAVADPELADG